MIEAIKLALEALNKNEGEFRIEGASLILRTAIEAAEKQEPTGKQSLQVEQGPVAEVKLKTTGGNVGIATVIHEIYSHYREPLRVGDKLYTTPPAAQPEQEQVAWTELCRRLYIELWNCDQQMTHTYDEEGEQMWRTGKTVSDVLRDAGAALDATPPAAPVQEPIAKVCHDLDGHIGWRPGLTELPPEGTELFTAQPAASEGWRMVPVNLLTRWRDAFAVELDAWDIDPPLHHVKTSHDEIDALLNTPTAAQPAPVQEPVGMRWRWPGYAWVYTEEIRSDLAGNPEKELLYTPPPAAQRTWVGLTEEEVKHEWEVWRASVPRYAGFAKGIEAKLKEKNT